jgi:hypothetical protein
VSDETGSGDDEPEWDSSWDMPVGGRRLMTGILGMSVTALVCWPAALSVGAGILATRRRRHRTVAWVGVVLGAVGLIATVVFAVIIATSNSA